MSDLQSFRKDAAELNRLSELTSSENVKRILTFEAEKLNRLAESEEKKASKAAGAVSKPVAGASASYCIKIVNYAWDQSDKFIKLYVTLNDVHTFPEENVTANFQSKCVELQVLNPDKKSHVLSIKNLLHNVVPSESYHKVKNDMVVLFLKKEKQSNHWACVTESEKKAKEPKTPKIDNEGDPSQSLMHLMKQMYDDGDDDMKRTIAKAWTEARDKKPMDDIP